VPDLASVTEKLGWATEALMELPRELAVSLPRFERTAQQAGQYLTLNSPYRKGEVLDQAVAEVEALLRSLIAARGRFAPCILQAANAWLSVLEAERRVVRAQTGVAREIPNPFVFGNPVAETEHDVFTGRRDIVRQVEESVLGASQTPTLLLHGPRRMGKTSILNQLPRLLGPDFAPAVVDCQNAAVTSSAGTLLRYLSRALSKGFRLRRVLVKEIAAPALEREPFAAFDEWLDGVEGAMPEKMRALLCLDEYERLQVALNAGWGGAFLDTLRHTLQHRPRVVLMFTGAHTFQELGPAWTDRFISVRRVRVSFLTREEVIPLLTEPIPEFDMTYAPGAMEAILNAVNGQPFLTQAVAFELVHCLNEKGRREATPDDVEEAIRRALVSAGEYFANVWSDAGKKGQAVLRAIVRGETPPYFPTAQVWLREHDVLNGAGEFAVPMVKRWVMEKM
jgi:DNA polymerase III delta prime subunit